MLITVAPGPEVILTEKYARQDIPTSQEEYAEGASSLSTARTQVTFEQGGYQDQGYVLIETRSQSLLLASNAFVNAQLQVGFRWPTSYEEILSKLRAVLREAHAS